MRFEGRVWTNDDILNAQDGGQCGTSSPWERKRYWMGSGFRGKLENTGRTDLELDVRHTGNPAIGGLTRFPTRPIFIGLLVGLPVIGNANQAIATYNLGRDIDALFAVETNMLINF